MSCRWKGYFILLKLWNTIILSKIFIILLLWYFLYIEYRCWLYFNQTSLCQCPSREESRKKASQVLNILILVEVYLKNNQKTVHKVKGFKIQYFYATVRGSNFAKKFRSRWKWFPFKVNIAWKDESKRLIIEWSRKTEIIKLKQ